MGMGIETFRVRAEGHLIRTREEPLSNGLAMLSRSPAAGPSSEHGNHPRHQHTKIQCMSESRAGQREGRHR